MAKATKKPAGAEKQEKGKEYGRGTGNAHPVDIYVGHRMRTRRLFLGMNQEALAEALGITFQQVQKYEHGANRVSASRLKAIADVFDVGIGYFFVGLPNSPTVADINEIIEDPMTNRESLDLIRFYLSIPDELTRHALLRLVQAVAGTTL